MGSLRIFIACPDDKLRLALLMFVDHEPGMIAVGIADRLTGLVAQLEGSKPDVLLLDWILPDQSMADLIRDLHKLVRRPKIIVFCTKPENKETIMAAGADYFIGKDSPPDELIPILNDIRLSKNSFNYKER
jgi:DNA-binding NarL/FixJ family response regulator